jgi:lipopolysaccharide transport system ATP-binding protein
MHPAITVRDLAKKFTIGASRERYKTLRDSLADAVAKPFRRGLALFKKSDATSAVNEIWALRNVSFDVSPGEVVGIIGRNGAGKSTLLKVLSRITGPTRGRIELHGRIASLLEVGTGFHPELSGRDNIYLNGAILGMKRAEIAAKFDEIVAFAEVDKFIDTAVKHYSSGMYMRLAFGVAAHLEPEILVIDEVLAVGDAAFQKKCLGKMEQVSKAGRTVLFVSHNMQAVRALCPRCILLSQGLVVQDGPAGEIISHYNNEMRMAEISADTAVHNSTFRRGDGSVRFTKIVMEDTHGQQRFNFEYGETIRLRFGYSVTSDVRRMDLYIALRGGVMNDTLTDLRYPISETILKAGTAGEIQIELPEIALRPGEYPLYFALANAGSDFDIVDNLSAPLIINSTKSPGELGFDPSKLCGYFTLKNRRVE